MGFPNLGQDRKSLLRDSPPIDPLANSTCLFPRANFKNGSDWARENRPATSFTKELSRQSVGFSLARVRKPDRHIDGGNLQLEWQICELPNE
jgi:hypothetical protein